MSEQLTGLSLGRMLAIGAGLLLFVASLLPWWHYSFAGGAVSGSLTGWHDLGPVAFILGIALLVWEGVRLAGLAPLADKQADFISAALAGLAALFALIFFITRVGDNAGWGIWPGLIALAGLGYAAYLLFTSSGGMATARDLQARAQAMRDERAAGAGAGDAPAATAPPPTPTPPVTPATTSEAAAPTADAPAPETAPPPFPTPPQGRNPVPAEAEGIGASAAPDTSDGEPDTPSSPA